MRFIMLKFALLALLSASALQSQIQDPIFDQWRWVKFTTTSGLPSNIVRDVVETKDRIWALTREGIAWFDDYQWHPIGPDLGLPTGIVTNLTAMEDGSVLVIVENQLYRGTERGFIHLPIVHNGTTITVIDAQPVSLSRIIVGSGGKLYDYENGVVRKFRSATLGEMGYIVKLIRTRIGLWMVMDSQLYHWEAGDWHPENLIFQEEARIEWMVENQQGERLGLKTRYTGASLYSWTKTESSHPTEVIDQLCITADLGPNGEAIAVDSYHATWLRQGKRWSKIPHAPEQFSQAKFLKYRDSGDLWLGTDQGLFLCRLSSDQWTQFTSSSDGSPVGVNEIITDRNGSTWIATARGLSVHPHDGKPSWFPVIDGHKQAAITALSEDADGHIWIGSGGGTFRGAYRYDGKHWQPIQCKPGVVTPTIHKIRRDSQGRLWFLALSQAYKHLSTETVTPGIYHLQDDYLIPWKPSLQLPSGRVYEFEEGPDGAYWFGTFLGLSRWQNQEWTHWQPLPLFAIRAIAIDSQNHVWFSDFLHGLGYLENDQIRLLSVTDGLPSNQVMDLAVDQNDTLWMTTWGNGLASYHDGAWSNHTGGMTSLYAWPLLLQGDQVTVGTAAGVHRMNIERSTNPGNRVIIMPPSVVNRGVHSHWQVFPWWGEILQENVETRYRLDQGSWSAWSARHEVSLFLLAYGAHQLEVQAKDMMGYFANSTATSSFIVPTPFYLRAVFLIPVSFVLVGAIWLLLAIQRRNRLHRRQRQEADRAIEESEERFRTLAQIAPVGIFRTSFEGPCTYVNGQYSVLSGRTQKNALGYGWVDAIHPDDRDRIKKEWHRFVEKQEPFNTELRFLHPDGNIVSTVAQACSESNQQGDITGYIGTVHDITERKYSEDALRHSLHEKETLLREIHHRVKNNLQIISSLLNFQAKKVSDPAVHTAFAEVRQRLRSMILVHEKLYQGDHLHQVDFADYTRSLAQALSLDQVARTGNLAIQVESDPLFLPIEIALPCGMILAELLTNVQKYAFPNGEDGNVLVAITSNDDQVTLELTDDGVGLSEDFSIERAASFGWRLIRGLTEQVGGTITVGSGPGTRVILKFSLPANTMGSSHL